jgi:GNAT superfamily N-acetyltransferase
MIATHNDPPISAARPDRQFTQTVYLKDGDRHLGRATWSSTVPTQGVVQILELWIDPAIRRSGHGRRLLHAMVDQARSLHKLRKQPLKRLWIGVGHKSQVIGRSFLTSEGFHHVGSTCGLLEDQDLLIYVKSLD